MKKDSASPAPASAPAPTSARPPRHEEIARHARALWEQYGKPAGRDELIWLEAERRLRGMDMKSPKKEKPPSRSPSAVGAKGDGHPW